MLNYSLVRPQMLRTHAKKQWLHRKERKGLIGRTDSNRTQGRLVPTAADNLFVPGSASQLKIIRQPNQASTQAKVKPVLAIVISSHYPRNKCQICSIVIYALHAAAQYYVRVAHHHIWVAKCTTGCIYYRFSDKTFSNLCPYLTQAGRRK
jgi:hypothetical protein